MADTIGETQLGRIAVDRKFLTPEELHDCLKEQKKQATEGKRVPLLEVMLQAGYVTRSQLGRLNTDMEDSIAQKAQQIPGFQIIKKLGAGAMATVFLAKQLSLDRMVAIKVLPRKLGDDKDFVERFKKEGKAAAKLSHNNIVQAIDVAEAGGYHYFVMEYVEGRQEGRETLSTVYDYLATGKVYGEKEALDVVLQIARALEHADERGFVHRDVKPKNIMITKEGVAKLADLGLARETSDVQAAMAERGRAYGTPYYISPEQIRGEVNIDIRADIYSLGATFYHMVTGKLPFEGSTPAAVMHKHLREPLIPPDHLNKALSTGVGEVIEAMMAKKPEDRYTTVRDLLSDLEAIRRGEPPLQARKRYDSNLLKGLADSGEAVDMDSQSAQEADQPATVSLVWVFVLGALLGISILVNVILMLTR